MPNIQIRDVSVDVHRALTRHAEAAGQSLQQYLTAQLKVLATTPTLEEMLDRIEGRRKGPLSSADAIATLDHERAGR